MLENDVEFFVYKGQKIIDAGVPVILTTIDIRNKVEFKAEYYIFIESTIPLFFEQKFSYDLCKEVEDMTPIDKNFMIDEILGRAKEKLYEYLIGIYDNAGKPLYLQSPFNLDIVTEEELLGLWFKGDFKDQINSIVQNSSCYPLKKLLLTYIKRPYITGERIGV